MADGQQGSAAAQDANGGGTSAGAGAATKTFTQEQLDAIVSDRLTRERAKYADHDDLKKAAAKLAELEKSQLSDKEKLERELKEARELATKLTGEVQTSKAIAAASTAGALYPDLVAAKIPADALGDDKKLAAALKEIRAQYPALFGGKATGSADGGAGAGKNAGRTMNDWIRTSAGR